MGLHGHARKKNKPEASYCIYVLNSYPYFVGLGFLKLHCFPLKSGTDLDLGHQVWVINYHQVDQKTSRLRTP